MITKWQIRTLWLSVTASRLKALPFQHTVPSAVFALLIWEGALWQRRRWDRGERCCRQGMITKRQVRARWLPVTTPRSFALPFQHTIPSAIFALFIWENANWLLPVRRSGLQHRIQEICLLFSHFPHRASYVQMPLKKSKRH